MPAIGYNRASLVCQLRQAAQVAVFFQCLQLGRLVPEKGIRYLVEAFKNVKTDKKLVIAGGCVLSMFAALAAYILLHS